MIYEKEVKNLLGAEVYKTFLEAVDECEISEQHIWLILPMSSTEEWGVTSKELVKAKHSNVTGQQPGLC